MDFDGELILRSWETFHCSHLKGQALGLSLIFSWQWNDMDNVEVGRAGMEMVIQSKATCREEKTGPGEVLEVFASSFSKE